MRSYETMVVFHPDAGEAGAKDLLERAKQVIAANDGEVTQVVDWGLRDLAYRIAKQRRGLTSIMEFKGSGTTVAELERNLRIWDPVLRYITLQVDPNRKPLEPPKSRRDAMGGEGGELGDDEGVDELGDMDASEFA